MLNTKERQITEQPNRTERLNVDATISGCNNNRIFQKELFSRFLPSTYAGHVDLAEAMPWRCMPKRQDGTTVELIMYRV